MRAIKKILMPTDFSRHADQALGYATMLATRLDADLTLFHAVTIFDDDPNNPEYHFPDIKEFYGKQEQRAIEDMKELGAEHKHLDLKFETGRSVSPATEIIEYASKQGIDLIVMGTHGRSAITHFLLGSVAERVVRHADCPVLTIAHHEKQLYDVPGIKRILVPLDFSDFSRQALAYAVELCRVFSAKLDLLHVVDQRVHPSYYVMGEPSLLKMFPDLLKRSQESLKEIADEAVPADIEVECFTVEGNPSNEIVGFSTKSSSDLIVMATHGMSGLEKFIIGSTTEKVIRKSHIPVFALKSEN